MSNIFILGSGSFGLAIANIACSIENNDVTVWSAFKDEIDAIVRDGEHKQKLPGVKISERVNFTDDISKASYADIIIFGIPSSFVRKVAKDVKPYTGNCKCIVNTGKGFDESTLKPLSVTIAEEIPDKPIVVLSGPSHAEEVAVGIPTTIVASSENLEYAQLIQDTLSTPTFRIYTNTDPLGCEIGGALKNIIALSAGICDGLGCGDNTRAALMTRGMTEITRLGVAMGAKAETFAGLTGLGDLIVTCTSMHSRNRRAGILIGQGTNPSEAVKQVGTVEGYHCCRTTYAIAKEYGVEMPITEGLYALLFEGANIHDVLSKLMTRPQKSETDFYK